MVGASKVKSPLVFGLGRAIQSRRHELKRESDLLIGEIGLSASYFRSIEAGSVAAPPSIAMPLAFALDWDPVAVSELLCALPYILAADAPSRREQLFERGVIASVLDAPDAEIAQAIRHYFEGESGDANRSPIVKSEDLADLPWMFELAMQKMSRDISVVPFKIDKNYLIKLIGQYKTVTKKAMAYLSYIPNGTIFETSEYDFGFLYNDNFPKLDIYFYDPLGMAASVKADLVRAIDRLTVNVGQRANQENRITQLEKQITVSGVSEKPKFLYASNQRKLEFSGSPGNFTKEYCNAWIYEITQDGSSTHVGFIDDFSPDQPLDFDTVALSTKDAVQLVNKIFT